MKLKTLILVLSRVGDLQVSSQVVPNIHTLSLTSKFKPHQSTSQFSHHFCVQWALCSSWALCPPPGSTPDNTCSSCCSCTLSFLNQQYKTKQRICCQNKEYPPKWLNPKSFVNNLLQGKTQSCTKTGKPVVSCSWHSWQEPLLISQGTTTTLGLTAKSPTGHRHSQHFCSAWDASQGWKPPFTSQENETSKWAALSSCRAQNPTSDKLLALNS